MVWREPFPEDKFDDNNSGEQQAEIDPDDVCPSQDFSALFGWQANPDITHPAKPLRPSVHPVRTVRTGQPWDFCVLDEITGSAASACAPSRARGARWWVNHLAAASSR